MTDLQFKRGDRALVVVAHPDDETIWMGGFIMSHPELDWTILSLCRASDSDRAPKFKRICHALGARAIITDLDDEGRLSEKQAKSVIRQLVTSKAGKTKWDFVFTHGANGEYGHPRHKSVHQVVKTMANRRELKTKKLLCLNYKKVSKYKLAAKKDSDCTLKLSKKEFNKKIALMTGIYGFDPKGIDAGYSTNPESFLILNS